MSGMAKITFWQQKLISLQKIFFPSPNLLLKPILFKRKELIQPVQSLVNYIVKNLIFTFN